MWGGSIGAFMLQGNMAFCTSAHSFDGFVDAISIGGYIDDAELKLNVGTKRFTVGGYANDLLYRRDAGCEQFRIGGGATDTRLDGEALGVVSIGGNADNFDVISMDGPIRSVTIPGDWIDGEVNTFSGLDAITVQGTVTNGSIRSNGGLGKAIIGGDFVDSDFDSIDGEVGMCRIKGSVNTNSVLDFERQVGTLSIRGPFENSTLDIENGGARSISINGNVDASTINVNGPTGQLRIRGGILNGSAVTFSNGLGALSTTGPVDASTITVLNGGDDLKPTRLQVGGAISGASAILTQGDAALVSVGGDIGGASTVTIEGFTSLVRVLGNLDSGSSIVIGAEVVSGSGRTYYTGRSSP